MKHVIVHRRGSYYYAKAFRKLVVALTLVYAALGVALAIFVELTLTTPLAWIIAIIVMIGPVAATWFVYLLVLLAFKRESLNAVEVSDEGIREIYKNRERQFIPWQGVTEIELAATIVAGASLRVKGRFSEIIISNVDLVITRPMRLREMHRALGKTAAIRELFAEVKAAAPQARLSLNKLARNRQSKFGWAGEDTATR